MAALFKPYEGSKPYFFVSYSHHDSAPVLDAISPMRDQCARLWYDEGIPAGSDWPENIAKHMKLCSAVLFFQSAYSLASPNCFNEIKAACEQGKKLYCVKLDSTEPDKEWAAQLKFGIYLEYKPDNAADLSAAFLTRDEIAGSFCGAGSDYSSSSVRGEKIPLIYSLLAAAAVLILLAGAGVYARRNIHRNEITHDAFPSVSITPQPAVDLEVYGRMWQQYMVFPDSQQKNVIQNTLGIYQEKIESERLADIRNLFFCGNISARDGLDAVVFNDNGEWTLNGVPLGGGSVCDLSLISQMPFLEKLALINQPVENLSDLSNLPRINYLSLAGCKKLRLETLDSLPSLETLRLEHSCADDLTVLKDNTALKTVTVSADMFPLKLDPDAQYDVVLVK